MNTKKKILYLITQSELGGAQRYVFDLASNMKNEFNEIVVAFGEQKEADGLTQMLKASNVIYYTIPHLKRAISPINDFMALIEIIKVIKKIKPDIIHLNSTKISILGSLAGLIIKSKILNLKSKIIYTVHGWVFNEPLSPLKKIFYKYSEKLTAILKDKIICVSEFDKQIAIKQNISPEKKLITIHNGIAPVFFLTKEQARQKLFKQVLSPYQGERRGEVLIGTIANLYKTKGLEYFIQATRILINQKLDIKTIIIGEGEERKKLENLIVQLNLKNNVLLTGKINDAAELLPAFDIYVCSSVKEGLSYTIIEAMQAGLPIVATNVGGNRELINDYKTGLLVEEKNPKRLAEKIKELLGNPDLKHKLGSEAKQKSEKKFTLEKMIGKTKDVYLKLL